MKLNNIAIANGRLVVSIISLYSFTQAVINNFILTGLLAVILIMWMLEAFVTEQKGDSKQSDVKEKENG
jgi:hypothetical protein